MSDPIILEVADGIATLTLNRPDDRNALSAEMSGAIVDAVRELEDRDDVRCLVVAGREGTFCAGGDVNAMVQLMSGQAELHEAVDRIQRDHRVHVAPRTERPLAAGDDETAHVIVVLQFVDGVDDGARHLGRQGVAVVRPVQR